MAIPSPAQIRGGIMMLPFLFYIDSDNRLEIQRSIPSENGNN
jgi:hypothetical protein